MSSPSTPRSTRSPSSGAGELNSTMANSPKISTPSRKIKAMLAAFDSDSESDTGFIQRPAIAKPTLSPVHSPSNAHTSIVEDEDDETITAPKGRMAVQMQAPHDEDEHSNGSIDGETAYQRVARRLHAQCDKTPNDQTQQEDYLTQSSEDEMVGMGLGKQLVERRKAPDAEETFDGSPSRQRSISPLFVNDDDGGGGNTVSHDESRNQFKRPVQKNARFLALVEQKRKEREERERIEAEKKAARLQRMKQFSDEILSSEDSDDEPGSGKKLTQQSRPTRKASKKALEEMNRETQRLSRNMQLAHQAKTKKKITKESFLARFNFGHPQKPEVTLTNSTTASSATSSDGEGNKEKVTPPTSPIRGSAAESEKERTAMQTEREGTTDLPSIEDIFTQTAKLPELVNVQPVEVPEPTLLPESSTSKTKPERRVLTKPPVHVRISRQYVAEHQKEDSDSDLEVVTSPAKCRSIAAFENFPARRAQESSSMLKLKALAHLTSPIRRSTSMSPAELSAQLRLQARQQAAKERQERIEELRARGIIIQTAEQHAAMEDDVENLMEKARKEAEEIARRERATRGKDQPVDDDTEEDEDYVLSGSDEEENGGSVNDKDDEEGEEDEEEEEEDNNDLVENEAGEVDESDDERAETMPLDEPEVAIPAGSRKRHMRVISDDEDEVEQEIKTPTRSVAASLGSAKRPQFPNVLASNDFTMSLTQAFAGTLADSQPESGEDSFKIIHSLPDPGLPVADLLEADSQIIVKDSQEQRRDSIDLLAGYTQSDARVSESPAPRTWSQDIPDPTQDVGFVMSPFDPTKRFMDPPMSTIDTVLLPGDGSPVTKKKGRLVQRRRAAHESDAEDDFEVKASAFDVMKKAAKKPAVPFDKVKSKAKVHVDEAAEESEDEYAGLGGASDDSAGEEDEFDRKMINDNGGEVVDEKELAALNANHQRALDEKQVSKLLKDITTGAFRRRRRADDDLDLDDSEDERMARQREKRRDFAKMRKALLADEKIGEIAANPKTQAFFKAIEDHDLDDDMDIDFLDNRPSSQNETSQDLQPQSAENDAAASGSNKRKRPLEPSAADISNRPPPHFRRTAAAAVSKKPSTLAEIRETVSFLIETPEYDSFYEDASMDEDEPVEMGYSEGPSQDDGQMSQERRKSVDGFTIPPNPRRTRGKVVDRLALLRAASSNSASSENKAAFQTSSTADALPHIGFRPPPLQRRTTTNSSSSSHSSTSSGTGSTSRTTTGPATTTKKGAINYYTAARERERERELRAKERGGGSNVAALLSKQRASNLGALMGQGQWE